MTAVEPLVLVDRPSVGVMQLTLNRPEAMNALNTPMLEQLIDAIAGVDSGQTRSLVLTGAGKAFSAGGDIKEERALEPSEFGEFVDRFARLATLLHTCRAPVVAAVNGYAIAGGFELAAQCDIRIVAENASLSVGDVDVGLSPTSGLTWALPRVVGLGNALYLSLLSPRIDGVAAGRLGFAQEVVSAERLLQRAVEVATEIAAKPGPAVQLTKALIRATNETGLRAAIERERKAELECFADPAAAAAFDRFLGRADREEAR
jgi:enoyl-CoA hydratase/carnithine racemase